MNKCAFNTRFFGLVITLLYCATSYAQEIKIATVTPISHSMTQALVANTPIAVAYLPPKRLPINRIASWLEKHRSDSFGVYQAVVNISSVVPELDIYATLRTDNIRIVPIDIARAIMPAGEKVVLANTTEYFWLNTNNSLVMLGILRRDLVALWPQFASVINANYQSVSNEIRKSNMGIDELLMNAEIFIITTSNDALSPMIASLSTDWTSPEEASELGLKSIAMTNRKSKALSTEWLIDDFSRPGNQTFTQRLIQQRLNLEQALQQLKAP
ncbi:hypothetical protein [Planctobacterium marinum]|uniref:hypothetical protein n=1 Tax=Planctobacterium marinum TaxID=1631968 RepID=UPI001E2D28B7|nr:hypothetical protein [Planctobacterium marinum]MCC2603966.1 hypothetical protein [Planctobacterium marinum]